MAEGWAAVNPGRVFCHAYRPFLDYQEAYNGRETVRPRLRSCCQNPCRGGGMLDPYAPPSAARVGSGARARDEQPPDLICIHATQTYRMYS